MYRLLLIISAITSSVYGFHFSEYELYAPHVEVPIHEYYQPACVDDWMWEQMQPYLLPEDHPLKNVLDRIFTKERVTASFESLEKAGFKCKPLRKWNNAIVARHKNIKGYVFKMYSDDQVGFPDFPFWFARIQGAEHIRKSIAKLGYQHIFKVPRKWLYQLPSEPLSQNPHERNFILICEDMKILSKEGNYERWRGPLVVPQLLDAVYDVLTDAGLIDSIYVDNIPFNKEGMVVFIDTEHFGKGPVPYHKMLPFLSKSNQAYWQSLIQNGGKRS